MAAMGGDLARICGCCACKRHFGIPLFHSDRSRPRVGVLLGDFAFDVAKRVEGGRSLNASRILQCDFCGGDAIPVLAQGFSATPASIAWMVGIGLVGGAGQFCLYDAARRLPAPVLAALEYTSILSAFALGYLMFGETPTPRIWFGAALILTSGLVVADRERTREVRSGSRTRAGCAIGRTIMADDMHDAVVNYIARTRFPFPGQKHWPPDYRTLTNVPLRKHGIQIPGGEYFPDIVVVDGTGRVRELGEVEMNVADIAVPALKATSETADTDTPTKVRHFFLYVPIGQEPAAQALLEANGVSYAGLRGFQVSGTGQIKIIPFVTPGELL